MTDGMLTSKERVELSLSFQEPDRPPIRIYMTPETRVKLENHFGTKNILQVLGVDFRTISPRALKPVPEPEPRSGIVRYDIWGVGYAEIRYKHGFYEEACFLPFRDMRTIDEVEAYPWPSADDYDYGFLEADCEALSEYAVCFGAAGIPDIVNGVGRGRGMEKVIKDIMTGDEVGVAIIDKRIEFLYEYCMRALEAAEGGIDILCLGEDCGTQNGILFPPRKFDEFFLPRLKRFYDLGHKFGAKVMMHSCGSTRDLIPTFIGMGLDVLDAVQPEPIGMNPEGLKKDFGDEIAFCGMISTQRTLPYGSVQDCRQEALHRVRVIGSGGGYILAPAHCIQPDTPIENILAIYEVARGKPIAPSNKIHESI